MKKNKKYISLFLALVLSITSFSILVANADDTVAINEVNFPDATFRQAVADYYDEDMDGFLSAEERNTTYMSVSGMIDIDTQEIKDLKGIEFFNTVKILRCGGIGLERLDVSALSALTSLTCPGNALTTLDVFKNLNLQELNCSDNDLTSLELPYNPNLTRLHCYANNLTKLDTFTALNLKDLRCDQNQLSSIDFSQNTSLELLNCSQNHLTSLNLSMNTKLGEVTDYMIGGQQITLTASLNGEEIVVPFTNHGLTNENYASCSLDVCDDGSYFDLMKFVTYDINAIKDGLDYDCHTLLAGSEDMSVHINVVRDGFYQVDFYDSAEMTNRIGKSLVEANGAATAPELAEAPQCSVFGRWSEDFSDVTSDMSVYPVWKSAHPYTLVSFDGSIATLSCPTCESTVQINFVDCINATADDDNYYACLDVVADGTINAKDYSKLSKMF